MLCENKRPTVDMMEKAWNANDDGGGIAWIEPATDGDGNEVVWRKGLNLKEITELALVAPFPFVAHFRIASSGGVNKYLTHPFPIDNKASLALEGRTKGGVLFHNGTWATWEDACLKAVLGTGTKVPSGRWSDTRAMAWLCSIYGTGFMEFLSRQKGVALMANEDYEVFTGDGWSDVDGIWCSNDHFLYRGSGSVFTGMCKANYCTRRDNLDKDGYCPSHCDPKKGVTVSTPVVGTGGSSTNAAPFPQQKINIIAVEWAQRLRKERKISKGLLERIKHHHARVAQNKKLNPEKVETLAKEILIALHSKGGRAH